MLIYAGQVIPGMFTMQVTKFYNQDELRKRWCFVTETTRADLGGNLSVVHLHFQLAERTDMQMYNVNQPILVANMDVDINRPMR